MGGQSQPLRDRSLTLGGQSKALGGQSKAFEGLSEPLGSFTALSLSSCISHLFLFFGGAADPKGWISCRTQVRNFVHPSIPFHPPFRVFQTQHGAYRSS